MRIEEVSPVEKKLVVEVPWAIVSNKLNEAFRALGKNVQLKGFRRGKVSRAMLEQMFGKRVRAEVAADLVRESFITATTEHQLEAVAEPRVEDELVIKKGQPFAFEAFVEVKGEVVAENYVGLPLYRVEAEVNDADLESAIKHLQQQNTALLPIEDREILADTDLAAIVVNGSIGDGDDAIAIENREMTVDLSDATHESYPGLVAALLGKPVKSEEPFEVALEFPADHGVSDVAGKTANLSIEVRDARQQEVPELDDEFAKDTGKADTFDELREVVRGELKARMEDEQKSRERDVVLKELVKRNPIQLAASLIERAVDHKYRQLQMMLGMQPTDDGPSADLREKLRSAAADEVRGQLLLEAIAEAEKVEVSEDEVNERVGDIAESQNTAPGRLRAEMERDGRLENIQFALRQDKTLDFLIEKAELTDEPPPEPETDEADEADEAGPTAAGDEEE